MGSSSCPTAIKHNPLYSKRSITSSWLANIPPVPFRAVQNSSASASHWSGCRNFSQPIGSSWKLSVFKMVMAAHFWRDKSCLVLHAGFGLSFSLSHWCSADTAGYPQVCSQLLPPVNAYFMSPEMMLRRVELCQEELFLLVFIHVSFFFFFCTCGSGRGGGNALAVARKSNPNCCVAWWLVCKFTAAWEQCVNHVS